MIIQRVTTTSESCTSVLYTNPYYFSAWTDRLKNLYLYVGVGGRYTRYDLTSSLNYTTPYLANETNSNKVYLLCVPLEVLISVLMKMSTIKGIAYKDEKVHWLERNGVGAWAYIEANRR